MNFSLISLFCLSIILGACNDPVKSNEEKIMEDINSVIRRMKELGDSMDSMKIEREQRDYKINPSNSDDFKYIRKEKFDTD